VSDLSAITASVPAGLAVPDTRTARPYRSGQRPANPALTRLAAGAAAVRRFEAERPWLVAQALLTGASPQQVVEVLGWELADLRFAIRRWASTLRGQSQLTPDDDPLTVTHVVWHYLANAAQTLYAILHLNPEAAATRPYSILPDCQLPELAIRPLVIRPGTAARGPR
jgi:hypothetical protein